MTVIFEKFDKIEEIFKKKSEKSIIISKKSFVIFFFFYIYTHDSHVEYI